MKTIGLIGGMSWESSLHYYRLINEGVRRRLGGLHSAKILLHSFDFAEIQALQNPSGWAQAGDKLAKAGAGRQAISSEQTKRRMNLEARKPRGKYHESGTQEKTNLLDS